jgi:hypothetical protein
MFGDNFKLTPRLQAMIAPDIQLPPGMELTDPARQKAFEEKIKNLAKDLIDNGEAEALYNDYAADVEAENNKDTDTSNDKHLTKNDKELFMLYMATDPAYQTAVEASEDGVVTSREAEGIFEEIKKQTDAINALLPDEAEQEPVDAEYEKVFIAAVTTPKSEIMITQALKDGDCTLKEGKAIALQVNAEIKEYNKLIPGTENDIPLLTHAEVELEALAYDLNDATLLNEKAAEDGIYTVDEARFIGEAKRREDIANNELDKADKSDDVPVTDVEKFVNKITQLVLQPIIFSQGETGEKWELFQLQKQKGSNITAGYVRDLVQTYNKEAQIYNSQQSDPEKQVHILNPDEIDRYVEFNRTKDGIVEFRKALEDGEVTEAEAEHILDTDDSDVRKYNAADNKLDNDPSDNQKIRTAEERAEHKIWLMNEGKESPPENGRPRPAIVMRGEAGEDGEAEKAALSYNQALEDALKDGEIDEPEAENLVDLIDDWLIAADKATPEIENDYKALTPEGREVAKQQLMKQELTEFTPDY